MLGGFVLALSVLAVSAPSGALVLPAPPPPASPREPLLACPTGDVLNFYCTNGCTQASWNAPTGADSGTVYEVLAKSTSDWCNLAQFGAYSVVATTTGTTSAAVSLPPNLVFLTTVRVQGCSNQSPYQQFVDTFTTPPAKPVVSVQQTGADVTVTYSQSDSRTGRVAYMERATAGGAFQRLPFGPPAPQIELGNYCPVGSQKTYVDPSVPAGSYQYRVVITGNLANNGVDIPSDPASIVVGGGSCTVSCAATVPTTGTAGQAVTFSGSATPSGSCSGSASYSWDFGDGTNSPQQSPSKTYLSAGTYSWRLNVTVGSGGTAATCTQSGTITIAGACTLSCQANVPTSVNVGQPVTFQGTASPTAGCASGSAAYSWDFGDGSGSVQQNPQKAYASAGTYQWKLTTTVPNGGSPVTCVTTGTITVVSTEACTVQCSADVPTTAAPGASVTFTGSATASARCTSPPKYTWDFGDGTSSLEQNPQKAYSSAGTYNWQLIVTIPGSESTATCLRSGSISIGASESCTISCAASVPTSAGLSQIVAFQGSATPSAGCTGSTVYSWDFGDGTTSSQQNPQKAYTFAGTFGWRLSASVVGASQATCQTSGTITVASAACVKPPTPVLDPLPASVSSGRSISVSWTGIQSIASGVRYVFETSRDAFRTVETSQSTRNTSAVVTTAASPDDYTLSVRAKAVADCGEESPFSSTGSLTVLKLRATFFLTKGSLALTAVGTDSAPGFVTFRNIGAAAGSLSLDAPVEGFVIVSPASLTLQPGEEGTFTVTPNPTALGGNRFSQGHIVADGQSLGVSLAAVAGPQPAVTLRPSVSTVTFRAVEGTNPEPQTITINIVSQSSAGPVNLSPSIGPGGAWLSLGTGGLLVAGTPITLRVDRSRRTKEEGVAPFRTLVRFTPVGGDPATESAVVEVVDSEIGTVTTGAGTRGDGAVAVAPPGGTSFIVPTAVGAIGVTSVFTSDGWLRNLSASPTSADLFFTPDQKDGLTDPAVLKTTISFPPGTTVRLSDLVGSRFQTSGAGQVEVRSARPHDLTLRTRVDSVSNGDPGTRYGGEIPTVAYGSGTSLGGPELVLPDISDDVANRANLILTETTGAPAVVGVSVYDATGRKVGITFRVELKAYSKEQLNRIVNLVSPGATLSGGWAGVTVVSGSGRVAALATVIDNRSSSFSAILGKGTSGVPAARSSKAAAPRVYVIPSAVRTVGANNTQFLTSLSLVNGTASPASLSLTYHYVDQDDGNAAKSVRKNLTIIGRGSLAKAQGGDVIRTFFGVLNRSYGYFTIEGDVGKVVGIGAISAQVDPGDPSKGLRTAQVNGTFLDAPEVIGSGDSETRFAGAEKSVQKRTNLVLLELAGQPANVRVRMVSTVGEVLAERVVSVGAGQYFQINDLFGDQGVNLGEGPFQNMEVTAQVGRASCRERV